MLGPSYWFTAGLCEMESRKRGDRGGMERGFKGCTDEETGGKRCKRKKKRDGEGCGGALDRIVSSPRLRWAPSQSNETPGIPPRRCAALPLNTGTEMRARFGTEWHYARPCRLQESRDSKVPGTDGWTRQRQRAASESTDTGSPRATAVPRTTLTSKPLAQRRELSSE